MTDEDAERRRAARAALGEPAFRERFAAAYGAADVLERFVTGAEERDALAALYGPHADDASRRRAALELERTRRERRRIAAAVDAALASPPTQPSDPGLDRDPDPGRARVAPAPDPDGTAAPTGGTRPARRRLPLAAVLAAAVVLLPAAYLAGAGTRGAAAPPATPSPTPTPLPAVLTLDDLDGADHVTYASPGDPRAASFSAAPLLAGYSVHAACLATQRRPRTLPAATVQLLDLNGRLIASWRLECDGVVRRFPALPPAEFTRHVQIVLDFDDSRVRTASAALLANVL